MRKIKVVILLAVVILSLILLNANAEDVNEGENFCLVNIVSNLSIKPEITAKEIYFGNATKYQYPNFALGDRLFITSLSITNNNNCTIHQSSLYFLIISPKGKNETMGAYDIPELKSNELHIVEKNGYGNLFGGNIILEDEGAWKIKLTIDINGYRYEYFEPVVFQVKSKTTLEILDLTKALADSSIESANAARGANELSKWAVILSSLAVITSVITLIVGIMQLRLENNQLESGKKQMRIQKKQTRILEEMGNSHKENDNTLNHLKNLQNLTLESEKQQERIEEKQTQILDEIKDILKNSRTPKG